MSSVDISVPLIYATFFFFSPFLTHQLSFSGIDFQPGLFKYAKKVNYEYIMITTFKSSILSQNLC